jgi:aryl-phospho-beta-D-glucosidase BglC (GH1 family)
VRTANALFIAAVILAFAGCPEDKRLGEDIEVNSAMEFVQSMKIGWNLGNALDAHNYGNPSETAWSNPPVTRGLIDAVAAQGFGAVRIPVTWLNSVGPAPSYTIDPARLGRVAEVVEWVHSAGMIAIINIHHDGADSDYWLSVRQNALTGEAKDRIDAQFIAMWTQIANYFRNHGNFLVLQGFNELHDGSWGNGDITQRRRVNELNQIFVDTVRRTGGNNAERFLTVAGWVTRPSLYGDLVMPTDTVEDRLIVNFHFYDPYDFAGDGAVEAWGNGGRPGHWANEDNVRRQFGNIKNWFIDKGIPVMIGEYGAVRQASNRGKAHRLYYMEYVTKYAVDSGFVPFFWDNGAANAGGEGFGLFNRRNYTFLTDAADIIAIMMRAVNEDYSIEDITPP